LQRRLVNRYNTRILPPRPHFAGRSFSPPQSRSLAEKEKQS